MMQNKLPIIGLTGNSGSGKNVAADFCKTLGGYTIDADIVAHESMSQFQPAYEKIIKLFGSEILDTNLNIDRKKLASIVFKNYAKLKQLENIVHGYVIDKMIAITNQINDIINSKNIRFVVWNAPLLVETKMHEKCDMIFLISADYKIKQKRIMTRDSISIEKANERLANQLSEDEIKLRIEKTLGSDRLFVIKNEGNLRQLEFEVKKYLDYFYERSVIY